MHSFLGEIYIKAQFLSIFVANEIFKSFFAKYTLLDTTALFKIYISY